jgi:hypothetical protein
MKFRKLRIAFSVTCGIACVLLILFWVRSYSFDDEFTADVWNTKFGLGSKLGRVTLSVSRHMIAPGLRWHVGTRRLQTDEPNFTWKAPVSSGIAQFLTHIDPDWWKEDRGYERTYGFGIARGAPARFVIVSMPHWFPILLATAAAISPWITWTRRFSLRTLLIGTTLVAIALGLIMYLAR